MENKLLPDNVTKQVKEVFSALEGPVKALFFRSEKKCDYCNTAEQLLNELSGINGKLTYEVFDVDSEMAR
ncbi:MAG TPA: glutaredoxin, partial [Mesotoga infera]|nr:glutaredoxin [Mesotoga infera]